MEQTVTKLSTMEPISYWEINKIMTLVSTLLTIEARATIHEFMGSEDSGNDPSP